MDEESTNLGRAEGVPEFISSPWQLCFPDFLVVLHENRWIGCDHRTVRSEVGMKLPLTCPDAQSLTSSLGCPGHISSLHSMISESESVPSCYEHPMQHAFIGGHRIMKSLHPVRSAKLSLIPFW